MSKFKVGDKVRLVKTAATGITSEDLNEILADVQEVEALSIDNVKLLGWSWSFNEAWLELVETKQNDFQTEQELWQWLVEGNVARFKDLYLYKFDNGVMKGSKIAEKLWASIPGLPIDFGNSKDNWFKHNEQQGYENIPEQGILCWVSYSANNYPPELQLVTYYDGISNVKTAGSYEYDKAIPVTLEEIEKYILKQ